MFADKTKTIVGGNREYRKKMAFKEFEQLFREFNMTKELKHKNIVEYKYFVMENEDGAE